MRFLMKVPHILTLTSSRACSISFETSGSADGGKSAAITSSDSGYTPVCTCSSTAWPYCRVVICDGMEMFEAVDHALESLKAEVAPW